jgi:hypothetical protein
MRQNESPVVQFMNGGLLNYGMKEETRITFSNLAKLSSSVGSSKFAFRTSARVGAQQAGR